MANDDGLVTLDIPANATVQITGFTNGGWTERIIVQTPYTPAVTWIGGAQSNLVVGQYTMAKSAQPQTLQVQMQFDAGYGFQPSQIQVAQFSFPGLSGYVVGGQDGGGRDDGPAYWNTVVFVYYAPGY